MFKIPLLTLLVMLSVAGFAQQSTLQLKNTTDVLMNPATNKGKHSISTDGYSKTVNLSYQVDEHSSTIVIVNSNKIISVKALTEMNPKTIKSMKTVEDNTSKTSVNKVILVETE